MTGASTAPLVARREIVADSRRAAFTRAQLTFLLQLAYSGELGAIRAYLGHRHSLRAMDERVALTKIVRDEVRHRHGILRMLAELGSAPDERRERKMSFVGWFISVFCHAGGWFFPMYGAARLEAQNIREYEHAARLAWAAGHDAFVEPLLDMAEVEWDHELFFRSKAASHPLWRFVPKWTPPPPRDQIRESFAQFASGPIGALPPVRAPLLVR